MATKSIAEVYKEYDLNEEDQDVVRQYMLTGNFEGLIKRKIMGPNETKNLWETVSKSVNPILETRFPAKQGPFKDVTAVIMGFGTGRTSLLNNICGTNYRAGQSLENIAINIKQEKVKYVEPEKFIIYNHAGTSSPQISLCIRLLHATLTHYPLNVIFVQVRFQNRAIDTIESMLTQLKVVEKYEQNVVYLVSHFDQAGNVQINKKLICDEMIKRKMNQQVIFYSNTRCEREKLAQTLYNVCTNYKSRPIQISEDEFRQKFRIGSFDVLFEKEYQARIKEIQNIKRVYIDHVRRLPNNEKREATVQDITLSFKYDVQAELQVFARETKEKLDQLDYYGMYFELQKLVLDSTNWFDSQTQQYRKIRS